MGLATTEYVRNRLVRSIQARELQETLTEFRAMLAELQATERGGSEGLELEVLLEVRARSADRDQCARTGPEGDRGAQEQQIG